MIRLKDEGLYSKCEEVTADTWKDCFSQAIKVKAWLKNKKAYAVTFNQLGLKYSCFVFKDAKKLKMPSDIIINPTFTPLADATFMSEEMCLSFKGELFNIKRYEVINASWKCGRTKQYLSATITGIESIIFQHEMGHINGQPCKESAI